MTPVYAALSDFLKNFSASYPLAWALLVIAAVSATSLVLYGVWELIATQLIYRYSRRRKASGWKG